MKLRGRELYIIAGVIAVVLCAAWFFLLFRPLRTQISDLDAEYQAKQSEKTQVQETVQRLEAMKKTAPQNQADLVRLNKLMPAETAMPSFVVALTQTAKASGLVIVSISPVTPVAGAPYSVEPIDLEFSGKYFDLEDFLYRLENYVDYRNQHFLVTGRMFQVTDIDISVGGEPVAGESPVLTVSISVNGFMWTPAGTVPGLPVVEGG